MTGAFVGDIVGSIYEFDNIKTKDFELFVPQCMFTDDTVMTIAVAKALSEHDRKLGTEPFKKRLVKCFHEFGKLYPDAGYGGRFADWLESGSTAPYNSYGNGSAMRVSYVGEWAQSLAEAEQYAQASAEVTHNHEEGIKGAKAVAGAVWLAKSGSSKEDIKKYVSGYYDLNFTLDEIRPYYDFDETCRNSVPQAIVAFLESQDFEDAVRCAVSIGGDSDTVAAITGSVAEAYYGIPEDIRETALSYLDDYLLDTVESLN